MWQKVFTWSKKIHRIVMWIVITLGLIQMLTGYLMNRELAGDSVPSMETMLFVRDTHVTLSMWFLFALAAQMLTGLGMWLSPKMLKRAQSNRVTE